MPSKYCFSADGPTSGSCNLSTSSSTVITEPKEGRYDIDVPFRAEYSTVLFFHADQSQVFVLATIPVKRSFSDESWKMLLSMGVRVKM